jgi:hypothetical protein
MDTTRPPASVVRPDAVQAAALPAQLSEGALSANTHAPLTGRQAWPVYAASRSAAESAGRRETTVAPPTFPHESPIAKGMDTSSERSLAAWTPPCGTTMRSSERSRFTDDRVTARADRCSMRRSTLRVSARTRRTIAAPRIARIVRPTSSSGSVIPRRGRPISTNRLRTAKPAESVPA